MFKLFTRNRVYIRAKHTPTHPPRLLVSRSPSVAPVLSEGQGPSQVQAPFRPNSPERNGTTHRTNVTDQPPRAEGSGVPDDERARESQERARLGRPAPRDDDLFLLGSAARQPRRRQVRESKAPNLPPLSLSPSPNRATAFPNPCRQFTVPSVARACSPATATTRSCGAAQWWRPPALRSPVDSRTHHTRRGDHHRHPKGSPLSAAQIRLFPIPKPLPLLPRTHARTASPLSAPLVLVGCCNRRRRCWGCSVGGHCSEEGAWRRGDCSRDELRRQQLRRVRYVWFNW